MSALKRLWRELTTEKSVIELLCAFLFALDILALVWLMASLNSVEVLVVRGGKFP